MQYVIGFLIGIAVATLLFAILAFFRAAIERKLIVIQKNLENAGPRPQGFVLEPEDDIERARNQIIEENRKQGKDTPISDLL